MSLGTLSVDLVLNGDGTFSTRLRGIDGLMRSTTVTAERLATGVNALDAALARTQGAQASTAALSQLASVSKALQAATTSMSAATAKSAEGLAAMAKSADSAAESMARAAAAMKEAAAAAATSKFGGFLAGFGGLPALAAGLGATMAAGVLASRALAGVKDQTEALVEAGDRYTQSVNRIEAVLGTSREVAAETYNQLEAGAQKTGIGVDELVRSFTGFEIALSGIGQSRQQIVAFTSTLATLAHISGTTSAAANRAFRELAEGLATGGVNLRQLKIVGQDMPPLLAAIANSLHVTVGQLEEMAGAGRLTTDTVAGAVETMSGRVQKAFGQLPVSLATARQNLDTALDQWRAQLDQRLGLSQLMAKWDQALSNAFQNAANNMDQTVPARLERAKAQLAELKALQAQGGAGVTATFADPTSNTSLSTAAIGERIQATQSLIGELQLQADAQQTADAASAASAKQTHDQTEASEALKQAMQQLGFAHEGSADQIVKLTSAVQSGHDVTVEYDGAVLRASQVLDLLRQKASPAAEAIAGLNAQLVEASARARGGFEASLLAARLKADPADQSGQGRNLSADQQKAIQGALDQIEAQKGQDAVRNAQRRLALAQARQKDDHGLAAGNLQARYSREDFIREHGTSASVTAEADQIFNSERSAAQLDAMQRGEKAANSATNAVTELRAKLAELNASMAGGDTETARWVEKLRTASPEIKAQGAAILDLAGKIDKATESKRKFDRSQEAMTSLKETLSRNTATANDALADMDLAGRSPIERQMDKARREIEGLYAKIIPDQQPQARGIADQAEDHAGLAAIRQQVDANEQAADQVKKSWADSFLDRRQAAIEEVDIEQQQLQAAIQKYAAGSSDYQSLTDKTAAYIQTRMTQALRQTESETEKLARTWSDQFAAIDEITASTMNSFVDTMTTQLMTGKASWSSFFDGIVKMLIEAELRFATSKLLGLGNAGSGSSSGGIFDLLSKGASAIGGLFGGATATTTATTQIAGGNIAAALTLPTASVTASGHHAGGLAGIEPTFTRQVPAELFDAAKRFHTGGIPGLRQDEIPAILQRGEGVFTKGQMEAMGASVHQQRQTDAAMTAYFDNLARTAPSAVHPANDAQPPAPKVTMHLHNQMGAEAKAVSSTPKFDGEAWVIDTVIKHANRPGNLRNALGTRS